MLHKSKVCVHLNMQMTQTIKNQEIAQAIDALKQTAKDLINQGHSVHAVANAIKNKFGVMNARLIMAEIASDLGLNEQARKYLGF